MEGGARIALGVGIGYLLGRTRKMRFALSLAGAAMSRRGTGGAGELLKRGTSLLDSSELSKVTDTVRGELLDAARSAAVTAASNRIDALNARLQQSAAPEDEEDRGGRKTRKTETDEDERAREPRDDEEEPAEEDLEDESPAEEEDEDDTERPATRTRTRRASPAKASRAGSRTSSRTSDTAERRTPTPRRRRARDEADEAPVRRTRR